MNLGGNCHWMPQKYVFHKLSSLTIFQSLFLLWNFFKIFMIMLVRHIYLI